ncbi:MAG: TlpA family protein disulfide reductase [Candidatus Limnocylindrales bacterium]
MTSEPPPLNDSPDRGARVTGPFSWRQLGFVAGVVAVSALALFVATRPIGTDPASGGITDLSASTPFLVGSPTVGLAPGDAAPELSVKGPDGSPAPLLDLTGKPVRLADLRGRLVLLNFWATWCPPCQSETPVLRELDAQYRARGLSIVGVAVQETTPADVAAYAAKYGITYTIGFDGAADVFHAYQVFALPTQVLIGPDGRVRKVINGPLAETDGKTLLEPLLPLASGAPGAPTASPAPSASAP